MIRWLAPLAIGGCGFSGSSPNTPAEPDAPDPIHPEAGPVDAAPDAVPDSTPPAPACKIGLADATGTNRGRAGDDNGGGTDIPLICANTGDRIVGFRMQLSDQNTVFNGRSAYAVAIACAPLEVAADGTGTTGTAAVYEQVGLGGMGWTPATPSTLTLCDPGWAMYGISMHKGNGPNGRFLDVAIRCTKLAFDGSRTAQNMDKVVMGSGSENNGADTAECNANEILATMPLRDGRGIDSVDMSCSVPRCQ